MLKSYINIILITLAAADNYRFLISPFRRDEAYLV